MNIHHDESISNENQINFLWLEITGKCNLECSHCYADSGPNNDLYGAMTVNDWMKVIDDAAKLGCKGIQFIGGEPTLHPDLANLIKFAKGKNYQTIEVYTNATRLNEKIISCFKDNDVNIATSFYSHRADIHQSITKGPDSWRHTVSGIKRSLEANIHLRVGVIETENNKNDMPEAINFLRDLGVKNIGVDRQRKVGRADVQAIKWAEEQFSELCGQCWKGRLCVTSSGETYPCVFSRNTLLGNIKDGMTEILESNALNKFSKKLQEIEIGRINSKKIHADCAPVNTCAPQVCNPTLPCSPQGPFCSPDNACTPGACSPSNQIADYINHNKLYADCNPVDTCSPQVCNPTLPCSPQGPFCSPDNACTPGACSPSNNISQKNNHISQ